MSEDDNTFMVMPNSSSQTWLMTVEVRWFQKSRRTTTQRPVLQQAQRCRETGEFRWIDVPVAFGDD